MIEFLEPTFTYGDFPQTPVASDLALKTDTTEAEASAMIKLAWLQVENFTKRTYRDINSGVVIIGVTVEMPFHWPRFPFPANISVEVQSEGAWVPHWETYVAVAGLVELVPRTLYRLTQVGTVSAWPASEAVVQAVSNLAEYQLIQAPHRREFKSQTAGDTGFTRETLMGVLYGSGAGAMLAGEVRT